MIPPHKASYLQRIRKESAYSWFRAFVGIISLVIIALGGAWLLFGTILGLFVGSFSGTMGILSAIIPAVGGVIVMGLGVVLREASIMVADIADSITDLNCRYEAGDQ